MVLRAGSKLARWEYPLSLAKVEPSPSVPLPEDYAPSAFDSQDSKTSKDRGIWPFWERYQCNNQPGPNSSIAKCSPKSGNVPMPNNRWRGFIPKVPRPSLSVVHSSKSEVSQANPNLDPIRIFERFLVPSGIKKAWAVDKELLKVFAPARKLLIKIFGSNKLKIRSSKISTRALTPSRGSRTLSKSAGDCLGSVP